MLDQAAHRQALQPFFDRAGRGTCSDAGAGVAGDCWSCGGCDMPIGSYALPEKASCEGKIRHQDVESDGVQAYGGEEFARSMGALDANFSESWQVRLRCALCHHASSPMCDRRVRLSNLIELFEFNIQRLGSLSKRYANAEPRTPSRLATECGFPLPPPHLNRHLPKDPVHCLQPLHLPIRTAQSKLISPQYTRQHHCLL